MTKIATITIIALSVLSAAANVSSSQTPYIAIYFDRDLQHTAVICPDQLPYSKFDTLYVVSHNFNMQMVSVEYKIDYTWALYFIMDIISSGHTSEGTSPSGITINFPSPLNGHESQIIQRVIIWWGCKQDDCIVHQPILVRILSHPTSGRVGAVRWPDLGFVDAVGGTSILCPNASPVNSGTWGQIKTLYN